MKLELELVPEEEIAIRSKKSIGGKKGQKGPEIEAPKSGIDKVKEEKEPSRANIPTSAVVVTTELGVENIVKRIYFPGDTYSQKENQKEFKKILSTYKLTWVRGMMKSYARKDGALLTGIYASGDGKKKVLCIYEGTNKPMTAIVKIMGSGGTFLIDLTFFCHKIGCTIEDKDEAYVNNIMLTLQEKGEIYLEKKIENKTLEEVQKEYDEKVEKRINDILDKYIESHRFYYDNRCESLFWKRGLNENFVRKFRRMKIEDDVRRNIKDGIR